MDEQTTAMMPKTEVLGEVGAGMVASDSFHGHDLEQRAETAVGAAAEQARALVEARYVVALRRPRDINSVRVRLLKDCKRPGFAAVAMYSKPVGGQKAEGPSIRLAEAVLRHMGNIAQDTQTVYDDAKKRIVRVSVTDLETNSTYSTDVAIEKIVERTNPKGRDVISSRLNSYDKKTYTVVATDDELQQKVNALVSKALRTNGLRLVPGDILDEAISTIRSTLRDEQARDPDTNRKRMIDGFSSYGIMPGDLAAYLGHPIEHVSGPEAKELHAVYTAIAEGETTWAAVVEQKREERGEVGDGQESERRRDAQPYQEESR